MKPDSRTSLPLHGLLIGALLLATPAHGAPAADDELGQLRRELAELRARLEELEAVKRQVEELEAALARRERDAPAEKQAISEGEAAAVADAGPAIHFGGALRFNYFWKGYDEGQETRRGDIGLDLFRVNADGELDNFLLSAEYRFYPYMSTIHHGWVGYDFGEAGQVQAGITRVPFGLLPYAAHNYWFGVPYYLGLSDDYDMGVKYINRSGPWDLRLAAFKNAELGDASNLDRYSYDPVAVGAARNEETNTLNARLAYNLGRPDCATELGVSAQRGELFNRDTGRKGHHWAAAAHADGRCGRWNLQLEAGRYAFDPRNPAGVADDTITLGAFAGTHEIAAEGRFAVANVAYNLPVRWPGVKLVTCYNDFSVLDKDDARFDNSYINTTGCLVNIGPTYTYVDIIRGRNAVFLGDGSLAGGGDDDWETRFNINFGYYW